MPISGKQKRGNPSGVAARDPFLPGRAVTENACSCFLFADVLQLRRDVDLVAEVHAEAERLWARDAVPRHQPGDERRRPRRLVDARRSV